MLFFMPLLDLGIREPKKLGDLFDIWMGVLDDGANFYVEDNDGKKVNARVLRMAVFDPKTKSLLGINEIVANDHKIKNIRSSEKKSNAKNKKINPDKILRAEDYLICTRIHKNENISGYSLIDSPIDLMKNELGPCVVSHHFICLRPIEKTNQNFTPYLHLMLDMLLDQHFSKQIETGNKNMLNVKTLKNYKIQFPVFYEQQKKLYDQYKELKNQKLQIEISMASFEGNILDGISELNKD